MENDMQDAKTDKKKLVLAVEDDVFLAGVHKNKMAKEGFEIFVAGNGREALEFLKTRKPDIILLDLIMPVMDGFETLKAIKENPETKDIKVVILSNLSQEEDKQRVMDMGALDYIVKANVSFREIVEKVKVYLEAE
jgi:two-component system, sensor histidine kinase and response regulator